MYTLDKFGANEKELGNGELGKKLKLCWIV
jgi:hypothetical protein